MFSLFLEIAELLVSNCTMHKKAAQLNFFVDRLINVKTNGVNND